MPRVKEPPAVNGPAAAPKAPASAVREALARVRVTLRGLPPGLIFQGKGVMEADEGKTGKKGVHRTAEEEAKLRCHWTRVEGEEVPCLPWIMVYRSLCKAASVFKFRGQKTMRDVVAATVSCEQDFVPLQAEGYEVYEEWCKIPPRTGAMVRIGRPRFRTWSATFTMLVDDEMYQLGQLKAILEHAGKLVGCGAWRPELAGPYGRFIVAEFEIL